jgi:hypothetical protein
MGYEFDYEADGMPCLIDLPVVRQSYCDQKMTDNLLTHPIGGK